MIKLTDAYQNPVQVDENKIRSIRSFTYGLSQTTVTRVDYDGGGSESFNESVHEVEQLLTTKGISLIDLHDNFRQVHKVVRSKIRTYRRHTYGMIPTTVTRIEYSDGQTQNFAESVEEVQAALK